MLKSTLNNVDEKIKSEPKTFQLRSVFALGLILGITFGSLRLHHRVPAAFGCHEVYRQDLVFGINNSKFKAQVSADEQSRTKGLSGRKCIPNDTAMLFTFPELGNYSFWMKDMNFPLDIIWLDQYKNVVTIKKNVQPNTYPISFSSDKPAQYVLELAAGQTDKCKLFNGQQLIF